MWIANVFLNTPTGEIVEETLAPPINYLVIEGGGVRGRAYGGSIEVLERAGVISTVKHIIGTSIGSIAAMLISLGYSYFEINEMLDSVCFTEYIETSKSWWITPEIIAKSRQYYTILTSDGNSLSSGALFHAWIEDKIKKKLGNPRAMYSDLDKAIKAGNTNFKYLSVICTNLSKNNYQVFDHIHTPSAVMADTLFMSCAYPGVFRGLEWLNGQGPNLCMDGGINKNLAVDFFNEKKYLPPGYDFTDVGANPSALCLKIDTKEEMTQLLWNASKPKKIKGLTELSSAIWNAWQSRDAEISNLLGTNIIQIYDADIPILKYDLNATEKKLLTCAGRYAALQWLQTHVYEAYQVKVYSNEKAWLEAKTIEELIDIKNAYESMLKKHSLSETENLNVQNKINWFKAYITHRLHLSLNEPSEFFLQFNEHINLSVDNPRAAINKYLHENMQTSLDIVSKEMQRLKLKIDALLAKEDKLAQRLHTSNSLFNQIAYCVALEEKFKCLQSFCTDLQQKLNIKPQALKDENKVKIYEELETLIKASIETKKIPHLQLLMMLDEQIMNRSAVFKSEEGVEINLDLRNLNDIKIYMIAWMLYLMHISDENVLFKLFHPFYINLFGKEELPYSIQQLSNLFQDENSSSLNLAYRVETIMQTLIQIDKPKEKRVIDLDIIFDSLKKPLKERKIVFLKELPYKEKKEDREMDIISYKNSNLLTNNPFIFYPKLELDDSLSNLTSPGSPEEHLPRHLRRMRLS